MRIGSAKSPTSVASCSLAWVTKRLALNRSMTAMLPPVSSIGRKTCSWAPVWEHDEVTVHSMG